MYIASNTWLNKGQREDSDMLQQKNIDTIIPWPSTDISTPSGARQRVGGQAVTYNLKALLIEVGKAFHDF